MAIIELVLLAFVAIVDSVNALQQSPNPSNSDAAKALYTGFSWDRLRNQFFVSDIDGRMYREDVENRQSGKGFRKIEAGKPSQKYFRKSTILECSAQAFHSNTGTLWRVERWTNSRSDVSGKSFIVGYNQRLLQDGKLDPAICHVPVRLPGNHQYTGLTVSPGGIVFAVDTRGGVVKFDPSKLQAQKNPLAAIFTAKMIKQLLPPSVKEGQGSPHGIAYHDNENFLIVEIQSPPDFILVDPDTGTSEPIRFRPGTKLLSPLVDTMQYHFPRPVFLNGGRLVLMSSGYLHLLKRMKKGNLLSRTEYEVAESIQVDAESLLISPAPNELSIFVLSNDHPKSKSIPYLIREYSFTAIGDVRSSASLYLLRRSMIMKSVNTAETGAKIFEVTGREAMDSVVALAFERSSRRLWRIQKFSSQLSSKSQFILSAYSIERGIRKELVRLRIGELHSPVDMVVAPDGSIYYISVSQSIVKVEWDGVLSHPPTEQHLVSLPPHGRSLSDWRHAFVYHDNGFLLVGGQDLVRVDARTGQSHSVRFVDSSHSFNAAAEFWGLLFLRDGRLVVGHSRFVCLLENVPPGEWWTQARIVATLDMSTACPPDTLSSLSLTPNDSEVFVVANEIVYTISIKSTKSVPSPSTSDLTFLWTHHFQINEFSPKGIAFDHSRRELILSNIWYGIGIFEASHFAPTALPARTIYSKRPTFVTAMALQASGVVWCVEIDNFQPYLVSYSRNDVEFDTRWHSRTKLPKLEGTYTGLVVLPSGVVFAVNSHGAVVEVHKTVCKSITPADEGEGGRGIVFHEDGFLIVGNRRTGTLTRVDVKSGVRRPISIRPAQLPTSYESKYPMGLLLLPDGRLAVLSSGHLHLLKDDSKSNGLWSRALVLGCIRIADTKDEEALFAALADVSKPSVVVLSQCRRKQDTYWYYTIALPSPAKQPEQELADLISW